MKTATQVYSPELITINHEKPAHPERSGQHFCANFGPDAATKYRAGIDSIISIKRRYPAAAIVDISTATRSPDDGTYISWIKAGATVIRPPQSPRIVATVKRFPDAGRASSTILLSKQGEYSDAEYWKEFQKSFWNSNNRRRRDRHAPGNKYYCFQAPRGTTADGRTIEETFFVADVPRCSQLYSNTSPAEYRWNIYDYTGRVQTSIATCHATTPEQAAKHFIKTKFQS